MCICAWLSRSYQTALTLNFKYSRTRELSGCFCTLACCHWSGPRSGSRVWFAFYLRHHRIRPDLSRNTKTKRRKKKNSNRRTEMCAFRSFCCVTRNCISGLIDKGCQAQRNNWIQLERRCKNVHYRLGASVISEVNKVSSTAGSKENLMIKPADHFVSATRVFKIPKALGVLHLAPFILNLNSRHQSANDEREGPGD